MLEKVIITIIVLLLATGLVTIWVQAELGSDCHEKGGLMLKQPTGWVCVVVNGVEVVK